MTLNLEILKQKKVITCLILIILFIFADFIFILTPQFKAIVKMTPQIKKLSVDLKAFKDDQKNLTQLKNSLENLQKKFQGLDKKIIQEDDLLLVIENISKIGRQENIKITQISPSEDQKIKSVGNFSRGGIYPVIINISIISGYHEFGKFINKLESLEQFLKVLSLEVKFDKQLYTSQNTHLVLGAFIAKK